MKIQSRIGSNITILKLKTSDNFKRAFILNESNIKPFINYNLKLTREAITTKFEYYSVYNLKTEEFAVMPCSNKKITEGHSKLIKQFFKSIEKEFLIGGGFILSINDFTEKISFNFYIGSELLEKPSREKVKALKNYIVTILSSQKLEPEVVIDVKKPISFIRITALYK